MEHSKLKDHDFKKGEFIAPWNKDILESKIKLVSWFKERLPNFIWIGLIFERYGREEGLNICGKIVNEIVKLNIKLQSLKFSEIIKCSHGEQEKIWGIISNIAGKEILTPLTALFTYSDFEVFSRFFVSHELSVEERIEKIGNVMKKASEHQSDFSTDIRFIAIYFTLSTGKLHIMESQANRLIKYPHLSHNDEEMRMIRPTIRSIEMIDLDSVDTEKNDYINKFWKEYSKMIDCELFNLTFEKESDGVEETMLKYKEVMEYYKELFVTVNPINNKMLVLLGISTYSYKRLLELVNHDLYNEISGRSIVRVMIEDYIMMKYLLNKESSKPNIWEEYKFYGIGQYKLISKRSQESDKDLSKSHVMYGYLDILANEFRDEEFVNMDTKYFDKLNVRLKADEIGEKELFGLYYDYDSAFEHGLWGAIRESSLIKCEQVAHQYHCVPDIYDEQKLKSVWHDCKMIMDKTIAILKKEYGLPDKYKGFED